MPRDYINLLIAPIAYTLLAFLLFGLLSFCAVEPAHAREHGTSHDRQGRIEQRHEERKMMQEERRRKPLSCDTARQCQLERMRRGQ